MNCRKTDSIACSAYVRNVDYNPKKKHILARLLLLYFFVFVFVYFFSQEHEIENLFYVLVNANWKGFSKKDYTKIINLVSLANRVVTRMLVLSFIIDSLSLRCVFLC